MSGCSFCCSRVMGKGTRCVDMWWKQSRAGRVRWGRRQFSWLLLLYIHIPRLALILTHNTWSDFHTVCITCITQPTYPHNICIHTHHANVVYCTHTSHPRTHTNPNYTPHKDTAHIITHPYICSYARTHHTTYMPTHPTYMDIIHMLHTAHTHTLYKQHKHNIPHTPHLTHHIHMHNPQSRHALVHICLCCIPTQIPYTVRTSHTVITNPPTPHNTFWIKDSLKPKAGVNINLVWIRAKLPW